MTLYPHLELISKTITDGLTPIPVMVVASEQSISQQGTPSVYVIPEDSLVMETIGGNRSITSLRFQQDVSIIVVLHEAGEQVSRKSSLTVLGELQASIVNLLCKNIIKNVGGPIRIVKVNKPDVYSGGFLVGKIQLNSQFVFNAE